MQVGQGGEGFGVPLAAAGLKGALGQVEFAAKAREFSHQQNNVPLRIQQLSAGLADFCLGCILFEQPLVDQLAKP